MTVNESYYESLEEIVESEEFDGAEEALSLCDLADWDDDSSKHEVKSSSSSFSDLEFFEFSSQELSKSGPLTPAAATDHVIFCGKLITRKDSLPREIPIPLVEKRDRLGKKTSLFRWRSAKSASMDLSNPAASKEMGGLARREACAKSSPISRSRSSPASKDSDFSVRRALLSRSATKSRQRSPLFGLARIPAEMEMSEIRFRQRRRRNPETMLRSVDGGQEVTAAVGRSKGKGLFGGLVRALGCWGFDPNAAVTATFRYVSPV